MKIKINGVVGWDTWSDDIVRQIENASGDIEVEISSEGGYVYDGLVIYNALKSYDKGQITIIINGYAMSIASYIAMAGDKVKVYDNSIFMIHNAWGWSEGDHRDMRKYADHLEGVTALLAKAYSEKTGKGIDEINTLLNEETFFYGDEIITAGLADEIITSKIQTEKTAALAKASELFAKAAKKIDEKMCEDADKTCNLLNLGRHMKQSENKPQNTKKELSMPQVVQTADTKPTASASTVVDDTLKIENDTLKAQNRELNRVNEINAIAMKYGQVGNALHVQYQKDGSADAFVRAILDASVQTPVHQVQVGDTNNKGEMILAMADGLALRAGAKLATPHADARMFQNAPLLAIARKLVGASEFEPAASVAQKVLAQGSSDFPILLSNVANKVLEDAWDEEPTTYQEWCSEGDVPDFKENTFAHVGGFGNLQKLYEKGELKKGQVKESGEKGQIGSKGLIVSLSREAIINDDLGAFTRIVQNLTQSGRRTLNADVYGVLTGTYKMSDNVALFHANHSNLAGTGTAITDAALTAGELAMMGQKGLNGEPLNISPYFLLTGPAKYREGKQILSSTSIPGTDKNSGIVNTWQGELTQIKDGNISGNAWYLAARNHSVKVLFLAGTGRRPIIEMSDINIAGVEYTIVFDYGVMVENFRTLYKNAGN